MEDATSQNNGQESVETTNLMSNTAIEMEEVRDQDAPNSPGNNCSHIFVTLMKNC